MTEQITKNVTEWDTVVTVPVTEETMQLAGRLRLVLQREENDSVDWTDVSQSIDKLRQSSTRVKSATAKVRKSTPSRESAYKILLNQLSS